MRKAARVLGRVLTVGLAALVAVIVARRARSIDWDAVSDSLASYDWPTVTGAVLLVVTSYILYAGYELLGRAYTGHKTPRPRVVAIALVSYAFNLNLGTWIGGIGFRYRLYLRSGLRAGLITRILGVSLATNWLGYFFLLGVLLATGLVPVPPDWLPGRGWYRVLALVPVGAVAAYIATCGRKRSTILRVRGHEIHFPPLEMALTQLGLSVCNWLVIASLLYVLFRHEVPFTTVLPVLMMASIAGVITHIPGGLGVLEAVFFAVLGGSVPQDDLLAALLAYRGLYYVAPFLLAVVAYVVLEARTRPHRVPAAQT
jgi:glycosyltransferase 2 family protein